MKNDLREILIWGTKKLNDQKINSAFLDAELLLSLVIKKPKEYLYTYPEFKLNKKQTQKYKKLILKRATHYPMAYIFGYKEFYGLKFKVNKNVLIPRPETELLVETTLRVTDPQGRLRFAEIGTGSGCIAISLISARGACLSGRQGPASPALLRKAGRAGGKNNIQKIISTDISSTALQIAKANAKFHQVLSKIQFIKGSLLKPLRNKKVDVIIANLPYLDTNYKYLIKGSDQLSLRYEPIEALHGGKNGLYYYQKLFQQASELKYQPQYLLIELDPQQIKPLSTYIKKIFPQAKIQTKKDLQGLDRVMIVKLSN